MQQINLDDQLYQNTQRRAAATGFITVDEFVADVLQHELADETEDLADLFTPQRLAIIDQADAEINAGHGIPAEQVREYFRQKYGS